MRTLQKPQFGFKPDLTRFATANYKRAFWTKMNWGTPKHWFCKYKILLKMCSRLCDHKYGQCIQYQIWKQTIKFIQEKLCLCEGYDQKFMHKNFESGLLERVSSLKNIFSSFSSKCTTSCSKQQFSQLSWPPNELIMSCSNISNIVLGSTYDTPEWVKWKTL